MSLPPKLAQVIAFPIRGALKDAQQWGKRHFSHHEQFSADLVARFIGHLIQNNLTAIEQMLLSDKDLATVYGNYFTPPLLIAAKHNNVNLVNLLLENGACPYMIKHDKRFKYLSAKMQSYFKAMTRFKQEILNKI